MSSSYSISSQKEYLRGARNSTLNTGGGSGTFVVPYDVIIDQVGTGLSLNTTTNRVEVSKSGGYVFTGAIQTGNYNISTNDTVELRVTVYDASNSPKPYFILDHIEADGINTGSSARLSGTVSLDLEDGESIEVTYVSANTSGALNIIGNDNGTYFTVIRVY